MNSIDWQRWLLRAVLVVVIAYGTTLQVPGPDGLKIAGTVLVLGGLWGVIALMGKL